MFHNEDTIPHLVDDVVLVKKKNGICWPVDFRDLKEKACPKDCFLVLHMEAAVERYS